MNSVLPNKFHGSLTFAPKITTYDLLAQRVRRALGEPLIQIEISSEQMYEIIDTACEYFTKFAGTTEEFLIFRSDLYIPGTGLPVGKMLNITPDQISSSTQAPSAGWDFDMNSFRRVVDVYSFAEGNNTGVNTLFTIEHTIAQQAYFGHLLGNVGYDLITWQAMKTWLDTRDKVLALTPYIRFDPYTQIMKLIPEPQILPPYYGLVGCHMQLAIKDIVSQLWVYRYTLALAKINIGHVRSKYSGTNLFGGQTVNAIDLFRQGEAEKAALEEEITKNFIDATPPKFFVG
jgi:hypothetical protein